MSATVSPPLLPWLTDAHQNALRLTLSVLLSCIIAFALNLSQPGWAMTTAAVVSLPSLGALVGKGLARARGTVIAAIAVQVIACLAINDNHLLISFTIIWVTFCTFMASLYRGDKAYAWATSGFTAAIIAFSAASAPDPVTTFYMTEARISEVLVGIVSVLIVATVIPPRSDKEQLIQRFRAVHEDILNHTRNSLLGSHDIEQLRTSHIQLVAQALDLNLLKLQAIWMHRSLRRKNLRINAILHSQLHLFTLLTDIRLLTKGTDHFSPEQKRILVKLFDALQQGADPWPVIQTLKSHLDSTACHWSLYQHLRLFVRLFTSLDNRYDEELQLDEEQSSHRTLKPQCFHADITEALKNAVRTLLASSFSAWFWIATGWPEGGLALTFTAACCTMLPSMPGPEKIARELFKAFLLLIPFVVFYKYGWMMQFNSPVPIATTLPPVIYFLAYKGNQGGPHALTFVFSVVLMPALLGIDYQPAYDLMPFINTSVAMGAGILSPIFAFKLIRTSSEQQRATRLVSTINNALLKALPMAANANCQQFEYFIYDTMAQFRLSADDKVKAYLLRQCIVALSVFHTIRRLKNYNSSNTELNNIKACVLRELETYLHSSAPSESSSNNDHYSVFIANKIKQLESNPIDPEQLHLTALLWQLTCNIPLITGRET